MGCDFACTSEGKNNTFFFLSTDAYSTKDIIYEWIPGEVVVGNKEMAQFEYKGAKLTSKTEVFTIGQSSHLLFPLSCFVVAFFFLFLH